MDLRKLLQNPNKLIWRTSLANDLGRPTQGVGTCMPFGTNTVFYVPKSRVATIRPHKTEVNRVHVTVDGNILDYPESTTTNYASLTTTNCLLNSTLSTPDTRFMTLDIKDFFYGTPMVQYEYMKLTLYFFSYEIIKKYDLRSLVFPNG